jgi:hypothetical protein
MAPPIHTATATATATVTATTMRRIDGWMQGRIYLSIIRHISSVFLPSFFIRLPVFRFLFSVPSSRISLPSSLFHHLSSVIHHLSSVIRDPSSIFHTHTHQSMDGPTGVECVFCELVCRRFPDRVTPDRDTNRRQPQIWIVASHVGMLEEGSSNLLVHCMAIY